MTPERRLRGETALFPNPTAHHAAIRWSLSGLEREWTRACARADVARLPLQQGTRHSILTALGQALPERVLRDFSRHRDARGDRPRVARALGPCLVPGATSPEDAEPNTAEVPRE